MRTKKQQQGIACSPCCDTSSSCVHVDDTRLHMRYILKLYKANDKTGENVHSPTSYFNDTIVLYIL